MAISDGPSTLFCGLVTRNVHVNEDGLVHGALAGYFRGSYNVILSNENIF